MSYWCGFTDTTDPELDSINMTSNVAGMWRLAGADLRAMFGQPAAEVQVTLATAVRNMLAEPEKYRALEPENGWGDYEGCVGYLVKLAIMAGLVDPGDTFRGSC
jgi:hypothetical protein